MVTKLIPSRGYGLIEAVIFGLAAALGAWWLHALALMYWPAYASASAVLHVTTAIIAMWLLNIASVLAVHAIDRLMDRWIDRLNQRLADIARTDK
jgi:4-hydroxybenzoate polyprenyltransferase